MAIIRDAEGKIYNVPDEILQEYLVPIGTTVVSAVPSKRPEHLCLDPQFDAVAGPHDGWSYMKTAAKPKLAGAKKKGKKKAKKKNKKK